MLRNSSVPEIKTRMIEQYTIGRQHMAKQQQKLDQVEQSQRFSSLVRNLYKPKISSKKVKEMEQMIAKTTANKPKKRDDSNEASPERASKAQKNKSPGFGKDFLSDLRRGQYDSSQKITKVKELDFGRPKDPVARAAQKQQFKQQSLLDSLQIEDPVRRAVQQKNASAFRANAMNLKPQPNKRH